MKPSIETTVLARRVEGGETLSAIGRELGITGAALSLQLKRAGLKGPGRVRKVPPDDAFRACATTSQLCDLFGVSRMTVSKHCNRLGIATRSQYDVVTKQQKEKASKGVKASTGLSPADRARFLAWIRRFKTVG